MSASIIIEKKNCGEIQAAMALALLHLKTAHNLTYDKIGRVIEREKQSVHQYICDTTDMPASCWIKAVAEWPELEQRLIYNLDEAEKAFLARQRSLDLEPPVKQDIAA
jgi:hypothetical protein